MTSFLFPILLDTIGTTALRYGLIVVSILGPIVPWMFPRDDRINLDKLSLEGAPLSRHFEALIGFKGEYA
jgi:hypothetical protein